MRSRPCFLAFLLLLASGMLAEAGSFYVEESVLNQRLNSLESPPLPSRTDDERNLNSRLNNLESQSIQRRGQDGSTLDLLRRQDDRIAGQELNSFKTRNPLDRAIPLLELKLDRSRRPAGGIGHR